MSSLKSARSKATTVATGQSEVKVGSHVGERHSGRGAWVCYPAIFGALFGCLWFGVDVKLIYHGGGEVQPVPAFFWGLEWARDFLSYPGGIGDYVTALMMQTLFYSWLGALILTTEAIVLWAAVRGFSKACGLPKAGAFAVIAPLLMLILHARYAHSGTALTALVFACCSLWFLARWRLARAWGRALQIFGVSALLYALAAGALIVFVSVWTIAEWRRTRSWLASGLALAAAGLAMFTEGYWFYGLGVNEVWSSLAFTRAEWVRVTPIRPEWILCGASAVLGIAALVGGSEWLNRLRFKLSPMVVRSFELITRTSWIGAMASATLVIVVFLVAHDRHVKARVSADYFASQGKWEEAYAAVRNETRFPAMACMAFRAAYHTRRLGREMPTMKNPNDILLMDFNETGGWPKCGLYLDLGFVNQAFHQLTESIEVWGQHPFLLRSMVMANLALNNTNTAKIYLNALTRVPFHAAWAKDYLTRLTVDPSLKTDAEVARLRSCMAKDDYVGELELPGQLLLLLKANRQNRMAFEYLMAYYLQVRKLDQFARNLTRVADFPGFELPPLWEEAVVLCTRAFGPASVASRPMNPASVQTFDRMRQIVAQNGKEAARQELKAAYGNTYFYYHIYGP